MAPGATRRDGLQWSKCPRRLVICSWQRETPLRVPFYYCHPDNWLLFHLTNLSSNSALPLISPCLGALRSSANTAGEFDHDLIHGEGLWSWPDGSSYAGQTKHGVREGKGLYVTAMKVPIEKQTGRRYSSKNEHTQRNRYVFAVIKYLPTQKKHNPWQSISGRFLRQLRQQQASWGGSGPLLRRFQARGNLPKRNPPRKGHDQGREREPCGWHMGAGQARRYFRGGCKLAGL